MALLEHGTPISATANNATSAVATLAATVGRTYFITSISASTDKATGRISVSDGSTVIWQDRVSSTASYSVRFNPPLRCTVGNAVTATTDGTAECNANISGFYLAN